MPNIFICFIEKSIFERIILILIVTSQLLIILITAEDSFLVKMIKL